jgi:hypothetical protein
MEAPTWRFHRWCPLSTAYLKKTHSIFQKSSSVKKRCRYGVLPVSALGRVDKRDSHRAAGMIQTGIYNGDQLGTRSDVGRGMGVL